jgi:hypothetical protein
MGRSKARRERDRKEKAKADVVVTEALKKEKDNGKPSAGTGRTDA